METKVYKAKDALILKLPINSENISCIQRIQYVHSDFFFRNSLNEVLITLYRLIGRFK